MSIPCPMILSHSASIWYLIPARFPSRNDSTTLRNDSTLSLWLFSRFFLFFFSPLHRRVWLIAWIRYQRSLDHPHTIGIDIPSREGRNPMKQRDRTQQAQKISVMQNCGQRKERNRLHVYFLLPFAFFFFGATTLTCSSSSSSSLDASSCTVTTTPSSWSSSSNSSPLSPS